LVLPILEGLNTLIEYGLRLKLLAGLRRSLVRENGWEVYIYIRENKQQYREQTGSCRRHTDKAEFVHGVAPVVSAGA
jgi:hypothetical protein